MTKRARMARAMVTAMRVPVDKDGEGGTGHGVDKEGNGDGGKSDGNEGSGRATAMRAMVTEGKQ